MLVRNDLDILYVFIATDPIKQSPHQLRPCRSNRLASLNFACKTSIVVENGELQLLHHIGCGDLMYF